MKDLNIKVKTALILIVTLLIGIVFGAMLYRAIFQNRIKKIMGMGAPEVFVRRFENTIGPTAEQKSKVRKILDKYAGQFSVINEDHREKMTSLFRAFREELAEVLTPQQMKNMRRGFLRPRRFPGRPGFTEGRGKFPGPDRRRPLMKFRDQRRRPDSQLPPEKEKNKAKNKTERL